MKHDPDLVPDAEVFRRDPQITLAEVRNRAGATLAGTARRDALSAFRALERHAGVDLATTVARAEDVRRLLTGLTPGATGLSEKRIANIRSTVVTAMQRFGQPRIPITRRIPPAPDWAALLDRAPDVGTRAGLSRLACYCTVKAIPPHAVRLATLLGLHTALVGEEMSKEPRALLKRTIWAWNCCHDRIAGWPDIRLASPFKTEPDMLPLSAFPPSFQADVAAWERRMSEPDPLDPAAPAQACRPATLQSYRYTFRRLATALVRLEVRPVEAITDLGVLLEPALLKAALRRYLPGERIRTVGYAAKMARQMLAVARHHHRQDAATLAAIEGVVARLARETETGMGATNRARLGQFDDEVTVQRLLGFPEEELGRALGQSNPMRRAKGVERALAIALAIATGLRIKNLRQLRLDRHLRRAGSRVFLELTEGDTKTRTRLDQELPGQTIALLDLFLDGHRDRLPGAGGPYLFPGQSAGPRSYAAMRTALTEPLRRHAGIEMSPHLYRHAVSKIVVERNPELVLEVSRRLGHKTLNTTYQSYLGTEGPAASRRLNALLDDLRTAPVADRAGTRRS